YFYAVNSSWRWDTTSPAQGGVGGGTAVAVCPGTALTTDGGTLGTVAPSAAVATVTVVNATVGGNFVAWGGAGTAPSASVLNFSASQVIGNTTVLPGGGRGSVKDFAILFNAGSGTADVIVDVVGYFVE